MARWDFSAWSDPVFHHADIGAFQALDRIAEGIHEIADDGQRLHILFRDKQSRNLMIFFHGAMPDDIMESYTLPVFSGVRIADNADADRLLISDATLSLSDDNLKLGWFSGSATYNAFAAIQAIIARVAAGYDRVILIGGSGGGFAALRASAFLPGSTALVWNPQTDIALYHEKAVAHYARACFDHADLGAIDPAVKATRHSNLCDLYSQPRGNRIIYFQNGPDTMHVRKHAGPFLEAYGAAHDLAEPPPSFGLFGPNLLYVQGHWPGGHKPPPKQALIKSISLLLATDDGSALPAVHKGLSHAKYKAFLFQ